MNRSYLRSGVSVLAGLILCLWPLAAGARPATSANLSAAAVAQAFADLSFCVDASLHWPGTNVITFFVRDAPSVGCSPSEPVGADRVVLVRVFPDEQAAESAYLRAAAAEGPGLAPNLVPFTNSGPLLVDGYGRSAWRGNVALVQSTEHELRRLAVDQAREEHEVVVRHGLAPAFEPLPPPRPNVVDADFLAVLDALLPPEA